LWLKGLQHIGDSLMDSREPIPHFAFAAPHDPGLDDDGPLGRAL
jgi:hypothetical protein